MISKKDGFLLIELLIALFTFIFFVSVCSWFIYISFQTKNLAIIRSKILNEIVNEIESFKINKKNNNVKHFNIKISKNLENFQFITAERVFYTLNKKKQKLILIGPAK